MSASNTGTSKRGIDVLHDPRINKSTGFTEVERQALGLVGLVPDVTESIETQLARVLLQLKSKATDLDRFIHLMNLLETNQTLFYYTLMSDPARFLEIVYDPTIGEACLKLDHIFRRPLGMYLSIGRKGHVREVLRNWPVKDVRFICVTNAGRILGLGDLGANGMGIPIGKLQLYTAAAGVPPEGLLPMYLDAGTNNETYLCDPLYVGLRQHRPATEELYPFVDEFVEAVQEVFPNCCIHFEDWTGTDAIALLARYRDKVCCYNDDIQGTAGVTLSGLVGALLQRKPRQLSGGQRQRMAMGRAIVREPKLFLFDEPLSNLDAKLRVEMRAEIRRLQRRMAVTSLYVTHDQVEAMTLGDRLLVMHLGKPVQLAAPIEVFEKPANVYVAGFIGAPVMNFLPAVLARGGTAAQLTLGQTLPLADGRREGPDGRELAIGIRPEHMRIDPDGLPMQVDLVEPLGSETVVIGRLAGGALMSIKVPATAPVGDALNVSIDPTHLHVFDAESGLRLDPTAMKAAA